MNTKTTFLRLFGIAAIAAVCFTACKKTSVTEAPKPQDNTVVTINGRTANPAQGARVSMTQQQLDQLKTEKKIRLIKTGDNTFTASGQSGNVSEGGRGKFNDCPPVSAATLQYYQDEANACCCSFAVCLIGENCDFYFYYFAPNNGCTGGNEM